MELRAFLARLALATTAGIFVLAFVEGGIRFFDLFSRERAAVALEHHPAGETDGVVAASPLLIDPFLGWGRRPDITRTGPPGPRTSWTTRNSRTNFLGFFSEVHDYRELEEQDFVVGVFGGSVANGLVRLGGDALRDELERRHGRLAGRVRVINLGLGGYKQPQQLILLTHMLLLDVPLDVVLNIDGYNEVALGGTNAATGYHPLFPSRDHYLGVVDFSLGAPSRPAIQLAAAIFSQSQHAAELRSLLAAHPLIARLALVRSLAGIQITRAESTAARLELELQGQPRATSMVTLDDDCLSTKDECWSLIADLWQRASEAMSALAASHGAHYLHLAAEPICRRFEAVK